MKALIKSMLHGFLRAVLLLLLPAPARAQGVGIGTATPDASAALDVRASGQGLLVPRLSQAQRLGIARPATGLLVFQTDGGAQAGFWFNAGTPGAPNWTFINPASGGADDLGNHAATQNLNLQGNALVGTGASIGTAVGLGVRADGGLNIGQNAANNNVFVGFEAGQATTVGSFDHFMGYQSGRANTAGFFNHFDGYQSGLANSTGSQNQFTGCQSGRANTTGGANQFDGWRSGFANTTGAENLFMGLSSGQANTTGSANQFTGLLAGQRNTTGGRNLFVGYSSGGVNSTGSNNWGFGYLAGPSQNGLTNAGAIGYQASVGQSNSLVLGGTGANAVSVGIGTTAPAAGLHIDRPEVGGTVGGAVGVLLAGGTVGNPCIELRANDVNKTPYIDFALRPSEDYTVRLIAGVGTLQVQSSLSGASPLFVRGNMLAVAHFTTSDQRLKTQMRPLSGALAGVLALRGLRYQWNAEGQRRGGAAGQEQIGLLAQEVEKVYPELVETAADGYKSVNYAQLTPVLLEAIKEQQTQLADLTDRLLRLEMRAEAAALARP